MKLLKAEAGVNDGKAGLLSAAGLFAKGGIFDKKSESFNIQELDPYLLFDARSSMLGTLENPTLDLDPATPSTLDVITATRASVATRTLPDGTIALAEQDTVRVDYTQGAELTPTKFQNIGHTDFANSYWTARGFTKVGVVDGPLGYTGYEFAENNTNPNPGILPYTTLSDGSPKTFSVWLKASSPVSIALATTGSVKTSTINVTTEWQFFQCTDSTNGGSGPHIGGFATITQGSGITLFAAMPQFEEGTTATTFVENTTGSPKFTGISATFAPRVPMILCEPSATNLIGNSDFSSGWSLSSGATVEQTTESTPMASQTALRLTSTQISSRYQTPSGYTSGTSTASVYIKWDGVDTRFRIERAIPSSRAEFNVTQGGVTHHLNNSDGYSIEEHGDGWWRVSNTMANPTWVQFHADSEDGDGSILVALPQHEAGSIPTSYIPTSGSTVTRAADDLVITGSAFSSFYNQSEGTFYTESVTKKSDGQPFVLSANNGTSNRIIYYYNTTTTASVYVVTSGAGQVDSDVGNRPSAGTLSRGSLSYKTNNVQGSVDGGSVVSDTSVSIPSVNKLTVGNRSNLVDQYNLNGHIKRLIYWPYHSDSL